MMSSQAYSTDQLVARARALAGGPRTILGIVGAPGSGKSTLADLLVRALDGAAAGVAMDGFHLEDSLLRRLGRRERKGAIDTFDDAGFAALMERLAGQREGEIVYAPRFDRALENALGSAVPIGAEVPLIITEGNYLLADQGAWPRARAVLAETWFLEPPEELRHQRLLARHRSYGKSAPEARAWTYGSDERNAALIAATAARADRRICWS